MINSTKHNENMVEIDNNRKMIMLKRTIYQDEFENGACISERSISEDDPFCF